MSAPRIAHLHYKDICRVLYTFIRILCKGNSTAARHCSRYSHIMLQHFSLDISAPDAFAEVMDNNLDLLQNHLTKDHINTYVELLCDGKMHPQHLEHLQRFCAFKDKPISRVQVSAREKHSCMLGFCVAMFSVVVSWDAFIYVEDPPGNRWS